MSGIISYGAYIPVYRLSKALIAENWEMASLPGEKAIASYDEDSLTMAIAAARNCLGKNGTRKIDALYFAATTTPYHEKQSAALIAAVLELPEETQTLDFCNSLRSGTSAIGAALHAVNSGVCDNVLVCTADTRLFRPKSYYEMFCGDGAVAFLLGKEKVIAEIEFFDTYYDEIQDIWRPDREQFLRAAEERFIQDFGYSRVVGNSVAKSLKKHDVKPEQISKVCSNFSNTRTIGKLFKGFGFDPEKQVQNSLQQEIGDTGTPMALMNAVTVLESAKPNQKILVSSYGNGCDNICIRTTERIQDFASYQGIQEQIDSRIVLNNYSRYLIWRGLVDVQTVSRPPLEERQPSAVAQWRETKGELTLCGTCCQECGTPQYPPQRICMVCQTKDRMDSYSFKERKGNVFSFSHDYVMETLDPPVTSTVVDFDGGGRIICDMTDRQIDRVEVGMEVVMTFRKLYYVGGIYNYWWKCKPVCSST